MGWSCNAIAGAVMNKWSDLSAASNGVNSSNIYEADGAWYMWEVSNREHNDGAITGSIHKFLSDPRNKPSCSAVRAGNFRIEPDGKVKRGPAILKKAAKLVAENPPPALAPGSGGPFFYVVV